METLVRRALLVLVLLALSGPAAGEDGPPGASTPALSPLDLRLRDLEERRRPAGWTGVDARVPLAPEEVEARRALTAAMRDLSAAWASSERAQIRERTRIVATLRDRLQRTCLEVIASAGPTPPPTPTVAEVRGGLRAGEAVVLYGRSGERMTAVLVTGSRAEEIDLGDDLDLADVVLAVREGLESDADDAREVEALTRLRRLVVAPLRLEASVRTVFLGANGALASVPGAALFPDRAVAVLPCLSVLRARPAKPPARENPVLAVGSPAFRTDVGRMKPLPGATREARELDTSPLLGPAATRSALRERLASAPRWRALHLAGLVESDAERPLLTSFGLATTEEDDGHWMAREIAQERIPADLVVLSACLACGTSSVPDAGVAALPCAFLTAGVPSVVGFVGRLDDEAGVAFAVALYAALREGRTTGDAVRVAREAVRSQARWAHPRYWLGWTLWGLPD